MHRYRLLGVVALLLTAGLQTAAQQPHRWNADYTVEYRATPVAGDSIADGLYASTYAWNFGILNGPSGPLGPSRIIVQRAPGLGPLQPDVRPGVMFDPSSNFPNLIFSRAMLHPRPAPPLDESSSLFFGGLVSQLPAPSYQLGFDVSRTLAGGREVAPGATELRTFELSFTVRDPQLTNMQGGINFQPFTPGPPPVTASGVSCAASSSNPARVLKAPGIDPNTGTNVIWDVTSAGATDALPVGESYTITCTVSLTNNNPAAPATYMPAAHAAGHRNNGPVETPGDFVQMPTNALGGPADPLGAVRFEVTGSAPLLSVLTTRFARRATLQPVNVLCRGSVRFTVNGPAGGGPIQLVVSGVDGTETLPLPLGTTEFHGIEPGTYNFSATGPAGFAVTPASGNIAVACGQLAEVFLTTADAEPPVIASVTPSLGQLWPPNNKMVPITLAVAVTDNTDAAPACEVTAVTSNEVPQGGPPGPAWTFSPGSLTVNLRASRNGPGSGRVYGVTVTCTDAAGNSSTGTTTVVVPHDQGR